MASFHLAVKAIGRSAGRSATAAAAYRAGVEITDERTGLVHDYTRKQGVEHSELMLPTDAPEWAAARERLWNAAGLAETRKHATGTGNRTTVVSGTGGAERLDTGGRRGIKKKNQTHTN